MGTRTEMEKWYFSVGPRGRPARGSRAHLPEGRANGALWTQRPLGAGEGDTLALDGHLSAVEIPELVDERFIGEVVEVPIQERSSGQASVLATRCVLRATPSRWEACFAADDESRSALRAVVELPGSRRTVRVPWTQVRPLQWPLWMPDRNRGCGWNLSMGVNEDDVGSVVMVDDTSSVTLLSDSGTQVLPRLWPMRLLAACLSTVMLLRT